MRNNEIVRVTFGALDCIKVRHFTQYDRGQVIEFTDLPTVSEVQFRKGDSTVKVLVDQNRVRIPDELLDECGEREAWAIIVNSDSTTTVRKMVLVVHPRTEPSEYIPPEDEPSFREQMAAIMDETKAVADSVRADADSGKFDGEPGPKGDKGDAGADGFSPKAKVERVSDGAEITITDKTGTTTAKVFDGQGGSGNVDDVLVNGESVLGADKVARVTVPAPYDDTEIKGDVEALKADLSQRPTDVQINGQSILDENKVANIPLAKQQTLGISYPHASRGIGVLADGGLFINKATESAIDGKAGTYLPIVPANLDYAVKSGLANSKIEWTDAEKASARARIGVGDSGTVDEVARAEIAEVKENFAEINAIHEEYIVKNPTVEINKVYSTAFKSGTTLAGYKTFSVDVNEGERWKVTTTVISNSAYSVAMFYDANGNYISRVGANTTGAYWSVSDYEVEVPANTKKMLTSVYTNGYPSAVFKRLDRTVVDVGSLSESVETFTKDRGLYVHDGIYHYFNKCGDRYIAKRFNRRGVNNLFQWTGIEYGYLSGDVFQAEPVYRNYQSDIIGPVKLYNPDLGYPASSAEWTGGNHGVTVSGSSVPTAEQSDFKCYVNNKEITEDGLYFGDCHIIVTNNLYFPQSITGASFDGAILALVEKREYYLAEQLNVRVWLDFKEMARVNMYYGMQIVTADIQSIYLANNATYIDYPNLRAEIRPTEKERKIMLKEDDKLHLDLTLKDVGLGSFTHNNGKGYYKYCVVDNPAWNKKTYFCQICGDIDPTIPNGSLLMWEGEYALYED